MSRWRRDEGGQALILIAAALGGLLLGIGLALDTGQLFVARRAAQTAADAGAWAGAALELRRLVESGRSGALAHPGDSVPACGSAGRQW